MESPKVKKTCLSQKYPLYSLSGGHECMTTLVCNYWVWV